MKRNALKKKKTQTHTLPDYPLSKQTLAPLPEPSQIIRNWRVLFLFFQPACPQGASGLRRKRDRSPTRSPWALSRGASSPLSLQPPQPRPCPPAAAWASSRRCSGHGGPLQREPHGGHWRAGSAGPGPSRVPGCSVTAVTGGGVGAFLFPRPQLRRREGQVPQPGAPSPGLCSPGSARREAGHVPARGGPAP